MIKNNDIHNFKILTIYSIIAYLFAYLVVFLFYNIFTAVIAGFFDIKTILNHNKLFFVTPDSSSLWNLDSAFYIFSSGTIFLTLILIILICVYNHYEDYEGLIKTFLFWIILHIINRILGLFIVGTISDLYYFNVILYWLFVDYWLRILMVIGVAVLLLGIGSKTVRPLLLSAKSFQFVENRKRSFFIWAQAFKTWVFSSIIIFLMHLPSLSYVENVLSITMFFLISPSFLNNQQIIIPFIENENEEPAYNIPWKYIIFVFIFILLFRIVLLKGIPF